MRRMFKVILADDEFTIRESMSKRIAWEKYGFELCRSCQDGGEVLEYLKKEPVDLIITDIFMPRIDGIELCRQVKEQYPDTKLLILSGYDEFEYAKKAIQYGVLEYLLKPVTSAEMGEHLQQAYQILEEQQKQKQWKQGSSIYRENYQRITSSMLMELISGGQEVGKCCQELERLGIQLPREGFRIAILEERLFINETKSKREHKQESALMAFIAYNIAYEVVAEKKQGLVCLAENSWTVLLFWDDRSAERMQEIQEMCSRILFHLKEEAGLEATIGIGSYSRMQARIPDSYEHAREALELRYLTGENLVVNEGLQKNGRIANISQEWRPFLESLESGMKEDVQSEMNRVKQKLQREGTAKEWCCLYFRYLMEQMSEIQKDDCENAEELEEVYRKLDDTVMRAETLELALDALNRQAECIIKQKEEQKDSTADRYVRRAKAFLEKHYAESDLGIREVCQHLNISTSYFSGILKNTINETFIELLTRIRMEHAKKLLKTGNYKTGEVSGLVGYSDPHYFGIVFKKTTGKTPAEYRRD